MWNLLMGNSESSDFDSSPESGVLPPPPPPPSTEEEKVESSPPETRRSGDGEENASHSLLSPELLSKLPPIESDPSLPLPVSVPSSPLVLEVPQLRVKPPRKKKPAPKEPKFVPYEPYKAAIRPILHHPSYLAPLKNNNSNNNNPKPSSVSSKHISPSPNSEEETKREIKELQDKLEETERNLKIQLQVNSEVKKLLVASVGEDLEARVDFLTQDKARLAADLRQYANKISRDFEEKETLSVESNLWKSKFLACSLLVDDLARWKGSLVQVNQDYEHAARVISTSML
uniref:Golgin-45 n=1 Tax=Caligus clemensi TaxID=344056 RepID=C1C1N7_CALCM|nr:Golgin-45 [Caligus clemensi]